MEYAALISPAITVAAIDQLTKRFAERRLSARSVTVGRFVTLTLVRNTRGSLTSVSAPVAATVCVVVVIAVWFLVGATRPPVLTLIGIGCAAGGAMGNLWDRFRGGGVVDFITIGRWPTFNVADVALCLGVVLAIVGLR